MVAIPAFCPVTIPLPETIVATEISLLLHVPPSGVLPNVTSEFLHTSVGPVITVGIANTVTVVDAEQLPALNADV